MTYTGTAGNPFSMCRSPRDLNLARSSSFNRPLPIPVSFDETGTTTSMTTSDRGSVFPTFISEPKSIRPTFISEPESIFSSFNRCPEPDSTCLTIVWRSTLDLTFSTVVCRSNVGSSFSISERTTISSSRSLALMEMVFLAALDFFWKRTGLELELVRLPSENRPLSAPPVAKFWIVDCWGSRPRIFDAFWNLKINMFCLIQYVDAALCYHFGAVHDW